MRFENTKGHLSNYWKSILHTGSLITYDVHVPVECIPQCDITFIPKEIAVIEHYRYNYELF